MSADIKRWLCEQLRGVESVRACSINPQGYLVVSTWSGTQIHVHLLDSPVKTRNLKRILQDGTRIGIGTLFLVDAALVPADGASVEPDEGLLALHALFRDKVYTYRRTADGPRIGQLHFKPFGRGKEQEVWYGPDIAIRNLPSYRVWVKSPQSIKGDYLIANFGTDAFWKQADYTAGRDAYRQQQARASGQTQFYEWSNPGWSETQGGYRTPVQKPPESELDRCYSQLGLERGASGDEVKAAFRKLARETHPDVSHLPKDEAETRFKRLYAAYRYIKTAQGW